MPLICISYVFSIASSTKSKARKRTADPQQMLFLRDSFRAVTTQESDIVAHMPPPAPSSNIVTRISSAPTSLK